MVVLGEEKDYSSKPLMVQGHPQKYSVSYLRPSPHYYLNYFFHSFPFVVKVLSPI